METREQWAAIARRWWLVAICLALGASGAFAYLYARPPQYRVTTYVRLEFALSSRVSATNTAPTQAALAAQAAQATGDFVLTKVAQRVAGTSVAQLKRVVKAQPVPSTELLQIQVVTGSASLAAAIANADAVALIEHENAVTQSATTAQEQPLQQQVVAAQKNINTIAAQIAALQQAGVASADPRLQAAQTQLQTALTAYTTAQKALVQLQAVEAEHATFLSIGQYADPLLATETPDPLKIFAAGGVGGLLLGMCLAFLLGPSNRKLRTVAAAQTRLETGLVFALQRADESKGYLDRVETGEDSPFGALWINLVTAGVDRLGRVLLVTGEGTDAGTSFFALSVGAQWAAEGKRVLMMDASLEYPSVASRLGLQNHTGLNQALGQSLREPIRVDEYIIASALPQLSVLPAGEPAAHDLSTLPPLMGAVIDQVRALNFDVIVVDGPALPAGVFVTQLAERADGVVVVIRQALVREQILRRVQTLLRPSLAPILALAITRGKGNVRGNLAKKW